MSRNDNKCKNCYCLNYVVIRRSSNSHKSGYRIFEAHESFQLIFVHLHTHVQGICEQAQFASTYMITQRRICACQHAVKRTQSHAQQWHISINGNSVQLWNQTRKVGILSLPLSECLQCPVFLPLSSLHLFYIMFSAISQTNSTLSFLCLCLSFRSNWGKWVWASRKKRTVEVSNAMNLAVEDRESRCA